MPAPLAKARSANVSRTNVASTSSARAIPAQTPATTRSSSARSTRGSASGSRIGPMLLTRARPRPSRGPARRSSTSTRPEPVRSTMCELHVRAAVLAGRARRTSPACARPSTSTRRVRAGRSRAGRRCRPSPSRTSRPSAARRRAKSSESLPIPSVYFEWTSWRSPGRRCGCRCRRRAARAPRARAPTTSERDEPSSEPRRRAGARTIAGPSRHHAIAAMPEHDSEPEIAGARPDVRHGEREDRREAEDREPEQPPWLVAMLAELGSPAIESAAPSSGMTSHAAK